jgi:GT2 family glycosyltransferase
MDLSIIIVNYKTPQLLADCLRTVYAQNYRYFRSNVLV